MKNSAGKARRNLRVQTESLSKKEQTLVGILAAVVVFSALVICTYSYGIGKDGDTLTYFQVTESLVSGKGFYIDKAPYTLWAPLYSILLALLSFLGLKLTQGAWIINVISLPLIAFFSARLFSGFITSKLLTVLAVLFVVFSPALLSITILALSEPLFILLFLLFIMYFLKFQKTGKLFHLVAFSVFASLACLQRYAGGSVIVIGTLGIVFLTRGHTIKKRAFQLLIFWPIALIPISLWFLRNHLKTGRMMGHRFPPDKPFSENISDMGRSITSWFLPSSLHPADAALIIVFVALVCLLCAHSMYKKKQITFDRQTLNRVLVLFFAVFVPIAMTLAFMLRFRMHKIRYRLTAPYLVYSICLAFILIDYLNTFVNKKTGNKPAFRYIITALAFIWLVTVPFIRYVGDMRGYVTNGPGGYSIKKWMESPVLARLRKMDIKGHIYTNEPFIIGVHCRAASFLPMRHPTAVQHFMYNIMQPGEHYAVIFYNQNKIFYYYRYSLSELTKYVGFKKVATETDGEIYLIIRPKNRGKPGR
jgi:hypothetical protein